MINKRVFNYIEFLNESEITSEGIEMGSYTRLRNNGIKISVKKFNEESEEDNLPGLDILIEGDLCELSYFNEDGIRNIEIPTNSIEIPDDLDKPEEITILKNSKWASDEDNIYALYEFIEDYLTEYYNKKTIKEKDPKKYCINETEILLSECGNIENINELNKFENNLHSFIGEDERYYKFKRNDKGPISSVEIYEKLGSKNPQLKLTLGKINECKIKMLSETYTISKKPLAEFKENFIFNALMKSKTLGDNSEVENSLKELLKEELKEKKNSPSDRIINENIKFLSEILIPFSSPRDIESYIRDNTI